MRQQERRIRGKLCHTGAPAPAAHRNHREQCHLFE